LRLTVDARELGAAQAYLAVVQAQGDVSRLVGLGEAVHLLEPEQVPIEPHRRGDVVDVDDRERRANLHQARRYQPR